MCYYIILYYIILYCIILYYNIILYYIILYYIILYYIGGPALAGLKSSIYIYRLPERRLNKSSRGLKVLRITIWGLQPFRMPHGERLCGPGRARPIPLLRYQ